MNNRRGCLFTGVLVGLVMIVVLTVVLFRNEGNSVNRAKALEHIDNAEVMLSEGTNSLEDGTLVILSGDLSVDEILTDDTFKVTAPEGTIKMQKSVSMYQWVEESETDDNDNTTYTYKMMWSPTLHDSSNFYNEIGHRNPAAMIYSDDLFTADVVMLGDYKLEAAFVNQLNKYEPYKNMDVKIKDLRMTISENKIFISAEGGSSLTSPEVGDYMIEYEIVTAETITAVGAKSGNNIISYHTKTGNLAEVSYGIKDKAVLKQEKIDENNRRTWAIRIGSVIGLMIAVGLLFSPITKVLGRIPLVGNIVNGGIALVGGVIGGAWGIIVIAVGWLYYKPLLAIGLIVGVIALVILISRSKKQKTPANITGNAV